ncbi:MAG: hypothetical protein Q8L48_30325 [Archangium sp.]|nr:hypothetical protein [Archangium sp.]
MLAHSLILTLAAAPGLKLAAPGFECVHLEPEVCALYTDTFAQLLAERGAVRVTTQREIAALLGLERQKQLLGCTDASVNCVAELAGALGVDGVVSGSVGRLGSAFTVNVKIVSARDGSALGARSGRVKDDDELHAWFVETAHQLSDALVPPSPAGLRGKAWVGWLAGGLAAGAGVTLILLGNADAQTISDPDRAPARLDQVQQLRREGEGKQVAGVALVAAGAAAALVGTAFFAFGAPAQTRVSMQVSPQLVGLTVSGVFP